MSPKKPKTTPKQAKFVEGVVRHGNAAKAAIERNRTIIIASLIVALGIAIGKIIAALLMSR